jgi:hypothetical protein
MCEQLPPNPTEEDFATHGEALINALLDTMRQAGQAVTPPADLAAPGCFLRVELFLDEQGRVRMPFVVKEFPHEMVAGMGEYQEWLEDVG